MVIFDVPVLEVARVGCHPPDHLGLPDIGTARTRVSAPCSKCASAWLSCTLAGVAAIE